MAIEKVSVLTPGQIQKIVNDAVALKDNHAKEVCLRLAGELAKEVETLKQKVKHYEKILNIRNLDD
ncbi:MAG: hypothetical protein HC875_37305 [Anaerolineales bacterium]|nr:hypothetical protein [Anaerolineales bacterium]